MKNLQLKATMSDTDWRDYLPYNIKKSRDKIVKHLLKTDHYRLSFLDKDADFKKTDKKIKDISELGDLKYKITGEVVAVLSSEKYCLVEDKPNILKMTKEPASSSVIVETQGGILLDYPNQNNSLKVGDYIEQEGKFYVNVIGGNGFGIKAQTKKVLIKKYAAINAGTGKAIKYDGKISYLYDFILTLQNIYPEIPILSNRVAYVKRGFLYDTEKQNIDFNREYYFPPDLKYFDKYGTINLQSNASYSAIVISSNIRYYDSSKNSNGSESCTGTIKIKIRSKRGDFINLQGNVSGTISKFSLKDIIGLKIDNIESDSVNFEGYIESKIGINNLKNGQSIRILLKMSSVKGIDKLNRVIKGVTAMKNLKGTKEYMNPIYKISGKIVSIVSSHYPSNIALVDCGIYVFIDIPRDKSFKVGEFIKVTGRLDFKLLSKEKFSIKNSPEIKKVLKVMTS